MDIGFGFLPVSFRPTFDYFQHFVAWRFFEVNLRWIIEHIIYNNTMPLTDDLESYQARWVAVNAIVMEERRTASRCRF